MDLDLLITCVLKARWGMCRPPSRAWKRIHRRARTLVEGRALAPDWERMTRGNRPQIPWLVPLPATGSLLLWRYDLLSLRLA